MADGLDSIEDLERIVDGLPPAVKVELRVSRVDADEIGNKRTRIIGKGIAVVRDRSILDLTQDHLSRMGEASGEYELRVGYKGDSGRISKSHRVDLTLDTPKPGTVRQVNPVPARGESLPDPNMVIADLVLAKLREENAGDEDDEDEDDVDDDTVELDGDDEDNVDDEGDDDADEEDDRPPTAVEVFGGTLENFADKILKDDATKMSIGGWINSHTNKNNAAAELMSARAKMIEAHAKAIAEGRIAIPGAREAAPTRGGEQVKAKIIDMEGRRASGGKS